MSQKLTLARYLEGRGSVKSLTRIEAEAFGVPYPLVSGWPIRHGDAEITAAMLEDLAQRISGARRSTASKALRGLYGAGASVTFPARDTSLTRPAHPVDYARRRSADAARYFPGFALRPAKRSCTRVKRSD